jgi:hypothetical protein
VEAIDPLSVAVPSDRIGASAELLDVLAPLTGVLLRTQRETMAL